MIGSAGWMLSRHQGFGKPEKRRCGTLFPNSKAFSEQQSAEYRHCEEPTGPAFDGPDDKLRDEAIQPSFLASGLLRGACHRARVRATRWLAMTEEVARSPSRPEFQAFQPGRDIEADLALHAERLQRNRIR